MSDESAGRILFVDDDADVLKAGAMLLRRHGFEVRMAAHPEALWMALAEAPVDVVLLDLNFRPGARSGEEGLDSLDRLRALDPDVVVVVVTGHSGVGVAVSAMRRGAGDFVMKPWSNDRLVAAMQDAVALRRRRTAGRNGGEPSGDKDALMIGASPAAERLLTRIARAATTEVGILLVGEPGVGKSLAARMIHAGSERRAGPFMTLDLSVVSAEEQRARLFGDDGQGGLMARGRSGTVFLKSAGALADVVWPDLPGLRDDTDRPRLLVSTNEPADLGHLPDRLRFELAGLQISVPPLRTRRGDILMLAEFFARRAAAREGRQVAAFSPEAEEALISDPWPGNVRELRARVEQAVLLAEGDIYGLDDVRPGLSMTDPPDPVPTKPGDDLNLDRAERLWVETALKRRAFNISHAAHDLGITRAALYRRMEKYGL